jgi:hypothetical protein
MGVAVNHDFLNTGRAFKEGAFDTDAITGNPADGEVCRVRPAALSYHGTFEFLDSFVGAFFDAQKDTDIIPNA